LFWGPVFLDVWEKQTWFVFGVDLNWGWSPVPTYPFFEGIKAHVVRVGKSFFFIIILFYFRPLFLIFIFILLLLYYYYYYYFAKRNVW